MAGVVGGLAGASAAQAETLADAIALAYKTNPILINQRAQLRVTDETYVQARAGFRPQISAQVDASRQVSSGQTSDSGDALLTASQPIYTGGRVASAVSAAEADILSGRETLRSTEETILQQVIQAYADVLRDQEGVAIRQNNLDALKGQVDEVQARQKVGDLTRTDLAQTQGYFFQARVDLASAKAQLEISRAAYAAVVGQRPGALEPTPTLPNLPTTLNQALSTGEQGNPSLRSSQYAEQAAKLRTAEARDQRLPNVSLRAQYGYTGPASFFQPHVYARDATATITFTQPLFAGGVIDSQIRQQIERQASARAQTDNARRTMVQQISQAWSAYLAAHENMTNADDEVQANAVAYEGVQKERRADLRSTLEVLYIEQSLRQAELARAAARHDAYLAQAGLLASMGLLEANRLIPGGVDLYDPSKAFDRVKLAGAVPWEIIPDALDRVTSPGIKKLPPPPSAPVQDTPTR